MVVVAVSTAGLAGEAFVAELAFAEVTEGTAAFGEVTATAGAGVVTAGADMAEAGAMADSVIPTLASAWALVSIPGRIGLDRISAITDIPIIHSTGATILMGLIPATPMVTVPIPTTLLPTVRI